MFAVLLHVAGLWVARGSELTDSVDATYAATWEAQLQAVQAAYLATHGRYAQTLWSHTAAPEDGVPALPDNLEAKPDDQTAGWVNLLDISAVALRARVKVVPYVSPAGHGYQVHLQLRESGVLYHRVFNYGPSGESMGWTAVSEEVLP